MHIAILDQEKCHPKKCNHECRYYCPPVRSGVPVIEFPDADSKPVISEELCIGCGICPKKCPFGAIKIINVPDELNRDIVHQYSLNSFRLYSLPVLKEGKITALLGQNGTGKTTTLNILSGVTVPNFGDYEKKEDPDSVLDHFSGTQMGSYFRDIYDRGKKVVLKSQYVDTIPKVVKGTIKSIIGRSGDSLREKEVVQSLAMEGSLDKDVGSCSGGELQKLAIATALLKEGDVYLFDEMSSYLDINERLRVADIIVELAAKKTVMIVEHDLAILDSMADDVHIVYGVPGAYGVVSEVRSTNRAVNSFLSGFLREENVRIRNYEITFLNRSVKRPESPNTLVTWPETSIGMGNFNLSVNSGSIRTGQIIGALGRNALGKTTFMKFLAGETESKDGKLDEPVKISYKPQYIYSEYTGTCSDLIYSALKEKADDTFVKAEIFNPMDINELMDKTVKDLSGGELQRFSIALALARDADLYLLDEPSAHLDSAYRMNASKVVRRVIENRKKSAVVIDHDIYFIDLISDKLLVFSGTPGKSGETFGPTGMVEGMNTFLGEIGITFRRDRNTQRPRINKKNSALDREQRESGNYYYDESS